MEALSFTLIMVMYFGTICFVIYFCLANINQAQKEMPKLYFTDVFYQVPNKNDVRCSLSLQSDETGTTILVARPL